MQKHRKKCHNSSRKRNISEREHHKPAHACPRPTGTGQHLATCHGQHHLAACRLLALPPGNYRRTGGQHLDERRLAPAGPNSILLVLLHVDYSMKTRLGSEPREQEHRRSSVTDTGFCFRPKEILRKIRPPRATNRTHSRPRESRLWVVRCTSTYARSC